MQINLSRTELEFIQDLIMNDIQMLYDDPCDWDEAIESYHMLKELCNRFYLNFEHVVKKEATECEIKHMNEILSGEIKNV